MSTPKVPTVALSDGTNIPVVGFGTGTWFFKKDCAEGVASALGAGYTSLDGAQMYGNSTYLGEGIKKWGGKREDVFVLTKCGLIDAVGDCHPRNVLMRLLKEMDLKYVDLYLVHSPKMAGPMTLAENWKIMEDLKKEGLTKSIGIANHRAEDIEEIAKSWVDPPVVNQLEYHPYIYHAPEMLQLRKLCDIHKIRVAPWGSLSSLTHFTGGPVDQVVEKIAKKKGATEIQIQHSTGPVVTTSSDDQRRQIQLESFTHMSLLTSEEVDEISEAGKGWTRRFGSIGGVWPDGEEA